LTISKEDLIVRTIRRNIARNAKKYAAKATVSAMMLAGGVMMASPILSSTVSAATEHWNDLLLKQKAGPHGKQTGINTVQTMKMYP
jgi:hypothetical protein